MFRAPLRRLRPPPSARTTHALPRRTLFTSSSPKKSTWRGAALRWGAALGAVYWYNTSPLFADDPEPLLRPPPPAFDDDQETIDKVIAQKKREIDERTRKRLERERQEKQVAEAKKEQPKHDSQTPDSPPKDNKAPEKEDPKDSKKDEHLHEHAVEAGASPAELEAEADSQGAFNPETGEINWDCPCLGGMAYGPCGEQFRTAFSCFVFSKAEPQGMDCIDKFQAMQDCFRQHPETYGEMDEETDEPSPAGPEKDMDTAIEADSPMRSSGKTAVPGEQQKKEEEAAKKAEEKES